MNESSSSAAAEAFCETAAERLARYAAEPVTAEHIETLDALARLGRKLAEQAAEEADALKAEAARPGEAGAAARLVRDAAVERFNWVSRNVRLTIDLRVKLLRGHIAREKRDAKPADAKTRQQAIEAEVLAQIAEGTARRERNYQRDGVIIALHSILRHNYGDDAPFTAMGVVDRWLAERDYETQVKGRPIGELIAWLCQDLAIAVDWKEWRSDQFPGVAWLADAMAALPDGVPKSSYPEPSGRPRGGAPPEGSDPPQRRHPLDNYSIYS